MDDTQRPRNEPRKAVDPETSAPGSAGSAGIAPRVANDRPHRRDPMFEIKLTSLLNRALAEHGSNTPDFLLTNAVVTILDSIDQLVNERDAWYGVRLAPGGERLDGLKTKYAELRRYTLQLAEKIYPMALLLKDRGMLHSPTELREAREFTFDLIDTFNNLIPPSDLAETLYVILKKAHERRAERDALKMRDAVRLTLSTRLDEAANVLAARRIASANDALNMEMAECAMLLREAAAMARHAEAQHNAKVPFPKSEANDARTQGATDISNVLASPNSTLGAGVGSPVPTRY